MALVNAADGTVDAEYEYGPFGEVLKADGDVADDNPFRFSTKYEDESGKLYYGFRYYDPDTGRWLNRDPIEAAPLYAFTINEPISQIDYLGLVIPPQENNPQNTWTLRGEFQYELAKTDDGRKLFLKMPYVCQVRTRYKKGTCDVWLDDIPLTCNVTSQEVDFGIPGAEWDLVDLLPIPKSMKKYIKKKTKGKTATGFRLKASTAAAAISFVDQGPSAPCLTSTGFVQGDCEKGYHQQEYKIEADAIIGDVAVTATFYSHTATEKKPLKSWVMEDELFGKVQQFKLSHDRKIVSDCCKCPPPKK